jgi:hypothetical protein
MRLVVGDEVVEQLSAAAQLLRVTEGGRVSRQSQQESATKTGTAGN